MISVKHLSKVFKNGDRELTVLRDVNCEIAKGEVIGIIGPSGTGKSTFLRCLNRLEEPSGGKIEIEGIDILDRKADVNLLRRKMGMVFQNFNLFHHLTILDNITLCPRTLLGKSRKEAETQAMELLQLVGLYDKAGSLPDELSGGQKQRAAIARCLAMDPEIILFDEPTSALDPTMVSEVLVVIRRLAREGMTMAIVSHEMQFVRSVSTRIFFMNEGSIYEEGSPEQIFKHPQRPATIAFVNRIRTLEFKLANKHFDLYGMFGEVGIFCNKYGLGNDMLTRVQHVMEEMLYGVLPFGGPVTLTLDYSEKDFTLRLLFVEDGDTTSVLDRLPNEFLPLKIVQGMCTSLCETEAGRILVEM
jgi:polar amino acid transport system ATP-binding protein